MISTLSQCRCYSSIISFLLSVQAVALVMPVAVAQANPEPLMHGADLNKPTLTSQIFSISQSDLRPETMNYTPPPETGGPNTSEGAGTR